MNYQDYDYATDTDAAPWPAAPASTQMVPAARNGQLAQPPGPTPAAPNMSEMLMLGSLIQSVQNAQTQQMYVMRDLDARLGRLEQNARPQAATATPSFERGTWWAIWGLLMLILGGALAVVIVLILLNIQFR